MSKTILMCAPTHFDIEYEINPWMHVSNPVGRELAQEQWRALHQIYSEHLGWTVKLIDPVAGLPDLVFTANGGLVIDGKVVLPQFRQPERQGETMHFENWFTENGYSEFYKPIHDFEGEGDALLWNDVLFAGFPWRSDKPSHRELERFFGKEVIGLQLTDARFYHLDTAFAVIDEKTVAIHPAAFTAESIREIKRVVPTVVEASREDAEAYGLNSMSDGENIVISAQAHGLIDHYRALGKNVWPTPIGEFMKSGGGVKCLTLELRT